MRTEGKSWNQDLKPSEKWVRRILLAEHSPIRTVEYRIEWTEIPYWVVMHLVRHHVGITHFVSTQRSDRTGVDRDKLPQDNLISYSIRLNAQSIISISRKRLCSKASTETGLAWRMALNRIKDIDSPLYFACVPECFYRGFCPERNSCGKCNSSYFNKSLQLYRGAINGQQEKATEGKGKSSNNGDA